jgi:hypothetical protein
MSELSQISFLYKPTVSEIIAAEATIRYYKSLGYAELHLWHDSSRGTFLRGRVPAAVQP